MQLYGVIWVYSGLLNVPRIQRENSQLVQADQSRDKLQHLEFGLEGKLSLGVLEVLLEKGL